MIARLFRRTLLMAVTMWSLSATPNTMEPKILVTLLGTAGGAHGGLQDNALYGRKHAVTLIEAGGQKLLFDAGRGMVEQLVKLGPSYIKETTNVFLTHHHFDHICDLDVLFLSGRSMQRKGALYVFGPEGTEELVANIKATYRYDIDYMAMGGKRKPEIIPQNIGEGIVYEKEGVRVIAFDVPHHPASISSEQKNLYPALGYRINYKECSVVISGDTMYSENLIKYAKGTDLLIHEVMPGAISESQRESTRESSRKGLLSRWHHTNATDAGKVFEQVRPQLVVYTHLIVGPRGSLEKIIAETKKTYKGSLVIGEDMMKIEVGQNVTIKK
ncbi:MBL fold metallo-hydrolase [Pontiella sulfatireligans]|uniref:Ribonuclease Z n=1 Tax=Pontiella sulfatireligans TaxID=2750658 RepID=A0A6C2UIP0_9BACT|nr:MBL fold metallo-hydrolase [Pontiella sulfatireligans]VGO19076.1 Ribonuclease Z [Pontiella sulfatireligans]